MDDESGDDDVVTSILSLNTVRFSVFVLTMDTVQINGCVQRIMQPPRRGSHKTRSSHLYEPISISTELFSTHSMYMLVYSVQLQMQWIRLHRTSKFILLFFLKQNNY